MPDEFIDQWPFIFVFLSGSPVVVLPPFYRFETFVVKVKKEPDGLLSRIREFHFLKDIIKGLPIIDVLPDCLTA